MRYGLSVICFAHYGEPARLQEVARAAEEAGWDGLFLWDHLASAWGDDGPGTADPWMLLAGAACVTERIRLGTSVTPLPRRRPHVVAAQVATHDRLSGGRTVLGVGLGAVVEELARFGEVTDPRQRAEMLDEALEVVTGLWSGEPVHHHGRHYTVDGVRNRLVPVQRPRVPIWVGGTSPPALRRAARWDGWVVSLLGDETGRIGVSPEEIAALSAIVRRHRASDDAFDVVVEGYSDPTDEGAHLVERYGDAGATWWLEGINGFRGTPDEMLARIHAGPPTAATAPDG